VLEVGLGGRWDATSIVSPRVAVITGIGLDHTAILGDSIEQIAAEKAAIIKPGCIAVLGPGTAPVREVFRARCAEVGATPVCVEAQDTRGTVSFGSKDTKETVPLVSFDTKETVPLVSETVPFVSVPLVLSPCASPFPRYQEQNIACARAAVEAALGHALAPETVQQALAGLSIPGRFELIREQPPLLIDASHNPQSARVLAEALIERYGCDPATGHLRGFDTLLLGILGDKDASGIIDALVPLFEHVVTTQSPSPRAIPAAELAHLVAKATDSTAGATGDDTADNTAGVTPESFPSVAHALRTLTARNAATVATGSITLAGEVKRIIRQR
jgi:dihydrofolate synthase/folylpolyglutamate synthase